MITLLLKYPKLQHKRSNVVSCNNLSYDSRMFFETCYTVIYCTKLRKHLHFYPLTGANKINSFQLRPGYPFEKFGKDDLRFSRDHEQISEIELIILKRAADYKSRRQNLEGVVNREDTTRLIMAQGPFRRQLKFCPLFR